MSENNNQNEPTPTEPQGLEPSGEPASGQDPNQEFRFGTDDSVPSYLQGKSQQEVIDFNVKLVQEATQLSQQQQQIVNQPAPQYTQPAQTTSGGMPDADLMLTDPQAYQQQLVQSLTNYQQQSLQQQAAPILQQQADTALFMSKNDKSLTEVWDAYGPEIEMQVANIPNQLRTKQLYDQAARLVKGNHADEIADKRAAERYEAMLQANPGIESSHGSLDYGTPAADGKNHWESFEKSATGQQLLSRMSKRAILQMLESNDETLESYAKKLDTNVGAKIDPDRGTIVNSDIRSFK